MGRFNLFVAFVLCVFSNCYSEISVEEKDRLLNGFVDYLNNLPSQPYAYDDGVLIGAQKTDENYYKIETKLRATDIHNLDSVRYLKCTATVVDHQENRISVKDHEYICEDAEANVDVSVGHYEEVVPDPSTVEPPVQHRPVQLDNEVQPNTEPTSGEQFVAIPREEPIRRGNAGCIGCGTRVDPDAPGVSELAAVGIKQLDRHEPNIKHSLNRVIDVERQVQVVNGVRYILTLLVDYNNCTEIETESCSLTQPCKISVLEKPWLKLPNGAKYRAIVANNCTDKWLFGDNGEVIPEKPDENKEDYNIDINPNTDHDRAKDSVKPTPDYDKIANTGVVDDVLKVIHNTDLQSQQEPKKLTEIEMKNLEEQIIPYDKFEHSTVNYSAVTETSGNAYVSKQNNVGVESANHHSGDVETEKTETHSGDTVSFISEDKRKAIDELMNFFDFAGFNSNGDRRQYTRMKRSFDYDLQVLSLAKKFNKIKDNIRNAKYIYSVAQSMIDYLNEMDMEVKNHILKDVVAAEEESDNDQNFMYIQARVVTPCEKADCESKDAIFKICNGVIDTTHREIPQILSTFCYEENNKMPILDKVYEVPLNDPVLQKLINQAIKKIESDSVHKNAMKVIKIMDANTQKVSGTLTKISAVLAYTNCNKTTSFARRKNCTVLEYLGTNLCDIDILERHRLKEKKVTYVCTERPLDESFSNTDRVVKSIENINNSKIMEMVQDALQYLEIQSNRNNKQKVIEVKSVSTQVIAGLLTTIEFVVGYTKCSNEYEVEGNNCDVIENEKLRNCRAQIWHRPWLEDGKQINVTCNDKQSLNDVNIEDYRTKRSLEESELIITGGLSEKDPNDPLYQTLANESMQKYLSTSGVTQAHKVVKVEKVTVQVVAGSLTRLDFTITPVSSSGDTIKCHSEVWEQPWLKKKEINVTCQISSEKAREKRQAGGETGETSLGGSKPIIPGGLSEKDPNDPLYQTLANESMQKYLSTSGVTQAHKVVKVEKVTVQVVAGSLTTLDFTITPVSSSGDTIKCHSEVWEQPWLKKKEINVTCQISSEKAREKRQAGGETGETSLGGSKPIIPGGLSEKDPSDPLYLTLANESMQKYLSTSGVTQAHKVVNVEKVTVQVVAGSLTRLDFTITPVSSSGDTIKCHSEVWEQPWLKKKEINVTCQISSEKAREKRQAGGETGETSLGGSKQIIPGGLSEKDPNDPLYQTLANESMQKYLSTSGVTQAHKVVNVEKVTVQVVAGRLTRLDFTITPVSSSGDTIKCHSEVWEQPWLKKKEINVTCQISSEKARAKRQAGGETEKNPDDPHYKMLAEKSLKKYLQTSGTTQQHKVVKITKVTVQVVAGTLTRLDFTVIPQTQNTSDVFKCHSSVWEQPWLNKTEIDVQCQIDNENLRSKTQVKGGEIEKDPNDPHYKTLAEESLQKYLLTSGTTQQHKVIKITKVTVQVVAGTITRLDFTVISETQNSSDVIKCHSKVWEQPWLNKTEIDVQCQIDNKNLRSKRQAGGVMEKDPNDPHYKTLAEDSLQKYLETSGVTQQHKVLNINKVTVQVVAGRLTKLDFTIVPDTQNSTDVIKCHSNVWEQPWLNKTETLVNCDFNDEKLRPKRELIRNTRTRKGGKVTQDPSDPKYKSLAEDSLRKYQRLQNNYNKHLVLEVKEVTTKVVAGIIYEINYIAKEMKCADHIDDSECKLWNDGTLLYCHTKIWDRAWLKQKEIDVSCHVDSDEESSSDVIENNHSDRGIRSFKLGGVEQQDVNKEEYRIMVEKAMRDYEQSSSTKYRHKLIKIHEVTEQVVAGTIIKIYYTMAPTTCLLEETSSDCPIQKSKQLRCHVEIWEKPGLDGVRDINAGCRQSNSYENSRGKRRQRRQIDDNEDNMDEDMKYYYAERAVQQINDHADTDNLHKLISIHGMHVSTHMNTPLVRMYIEIALTYCLRHQDDQDLSSCDEMDGLNHRLCHARLYPSPDDELVVQQVSVVCDDDPNFSSITGLSVKELLKASIKEFESSPDIQYKMVHQGEPYVIPSLDSTAPIKMSFVVAYTNCSKYINIHDPKNLCFVDTLRSSMACHSSIYMAPNSREIERVLVSCKRPSLPRLKRAALDDRNVSTADVEVQNLVSQALEKLEMVSLHRYKQRVLKINSFSSKLTSGKVTTIDFDVGYTACLKYEWVENIESCQILEHLPRRHCVAQIYERLWINNGKNIDVNCEDDETSPESHIEFESAELAMQLAKQALKHVEAKYPHPRKQKVVRVFTLEKQVVAGLHYRLKMEVGFTNCTALSTKKNCALTTDSGLNKFCRVNVWIRPWTDHAPKFRVSCDYQDNLNNDIHHQIQAEHLFYDFLATYKPEYVNDHVEMQRRFKIFENNVKKIHILNTHERGTATYAVTRFSDLSYEEFTSKHLGLKPSLKNDNNIPMRKAEIPKIAIPDKFDWRDHDAVTEVKDQGSCGSCWAFSVTGNIEGQWKMQSGQLVSLSEQELVDCDKLDEGCNGGLPDNAYRAIEQLGGLELENDYPYEGEDDKCAFNKSMAKVQISGAVNITSNETDMAKWLVQNGPISIGINANAMQFYVGGVSHPWKMLCNPKNLDHGVLIVGYGTKDYPLFHKQLPFWTIKNSWGKWWGEQGYYRVYRGDGTCGVNQMASSAII